MKPQEVTAEQVTNELQQLIEQYPHRLGSVNTATGVFGSAPVEDGETSCVYFLDENDTPISMTWATDDYRPRFVTPICIVGEWIHSFHPEFKNDDLVNDILVQNRVITNVDPSEMPFSTEVRVILGNVQSFQDDGKAWGEIVL